MEAALPNLLIRTVSDPADSPFSPASADHDPFGLSFRSKPAAGGGGSPLSVSPPALQLGVKEMKDVSPRSFVTSVKARPASSSGDGHGKAGGAGGSRGEDMLGASRLLSLGIWDDVVAGMEDLAAATGVVPGDQGAQGDELAKGGNMPPPVPLQG